MEQDINQMSRILTTLISTHNTEDTARKENIQHSVRTTIFSKRKLILSFLTWDLIVGEM